MGHETRGTVVPFPVEPRSGRPARAGGAGAQAVVIRPWGDHDPDAQHNEAWDHLLQLVDRAWTWRDPEALSEIDACLLRLGIVVETDWS